MRLKFDAHCKYLSISGEIIKINLVSKSALILTKKLLRITSIVWGVYSENVNNLFFADFNVIDGFLFILELFKTSTGFFSLRAVAIKKPIPDEVSDDSTMTTS